MAKNSPLPTDEQQIYDAVVGGATIADVAEAYDKTPQEINDIVNTINANRKR